MSALSKRRHVAALQNHFGKRNKACAPCLSFRFMSIRVPSCASAIWRLNGNPIPEPSGFVVKNGTNRLAGFIIPGPSSSTRISTQFPFSRQPSVTSPCISSAASTALCNRLINTCSICAASAQSLFRTRSDLNLKPGFQIDDTLYQPGQIDLLFLRRRKLCQPCVSFQETTQRIGARGDGV